MRWVCAHNRARFDADSSGGGGGSRTPTAADEAAHRLDVLLTYGGWREDSWADHIPRLLEPFGVRTTRAGSGREATDVIRKRPPHVAVVDLGLPLDHAETQDGALQEGGPKLLQLLARLEAPPPTIIVRQARGRRDDARTLAAALRHGAFAVVDRPVELETMLEILRRVLGRVHRGHWPGGDA